MEKDIIEPQARESWSAEELAGILGITKNPANGEMRYELDPKGLLQQFVMGQIASYEQYKKQKRMASIINPFKS